MIRKKAHIKRLAKEMGVKVNFLRGDGRNGWADSKEEITITGWNSKDSVSYFVTLHELGHTVFGTVGNRNPPETKNVLEEEAEAWIWAFENSIVEPNEKIMKNMKELWLGLYYKNRNFWQGTIPPGPKFHSFVSATGLILEENENGTTCRSR